MVTYGTTVREASRPRKPRASRKQLKVEPIVEAIMQKRITGQGYCTPIIRWGELRGEELVERAQEKADEYGIPDPDTFRAVFKGINFWLEKKGYSADCLEYGRKAPRQPEAPAQEAPEQRDTLPPGSYVREIDWKAMEPDEVWERAQEKVYENHVPDAVTFRRVYKGIAEALIHHGLSPDHLDYSRSQPPKEEKKEMPQSGIRVRSWDALDDDQVLYLVHVAADISGLRDMESFKRRYRGIYKQLVDRGLVNGLEFCA